MARTTVVAKLIDFVGDDDGNDFWRMWDGDHNTPRAMVESFRYSMGYLIDNLEDDEADLGSLIRDLINDLDREEEFELGSALLHMKDQR